MPSCNSHPPLPDRIQHIRVPLQRWQLLGIHTDRQNPSGLRRMQMPHAHKHAFLRMPQHPESCSPVRASPSSSGCSHRPELGKQICTFSWHLKRLTRISLEIIIWGVGNTSRFAQTFFPPKPKVYHEPNREAPPSGCAGAPKPLFFNGFSSLYYTTTRPKSVPLPSRCAASGFF